MPKADLYNLENKKTGEIELPAEVFGVKWNAALVKQALLAQLANRRQPWAHAKDRSEVRGGGKKPWRQKGTGRARHGSIRSPIWIGGGKAHGPLKERDYSQKLNKKMKRLAIFSALSRKLKDGQITFLETTALAEPKTKILAGHLKNLGAAPRKPDMLLIPDAENKMVYRAVRNLPKTKALSPESLNIYDILNYRRILIDQKAVPAIAKHFLKK